MSWEHVSKHFHCLLQGPALRWYFSFMHDMRRENIPVQWAILRNALLRHFRRSETDADLTRVLHDRKMGPSEKFEDFYEEVMKIHDKLSNPKSHEELISIMKRNISNRLYPITYGIRSVDLDSFRLEVLRAEYDLNFRYPPSTSKGNGPTQRTYYSDQRRVAELDFNTGESGSVPENDLPSVEEIRQSNTENILCGNCRQEGHKWYHCPSPERSIFCYRCLRQGELYPTCSNCSQGNSYQGVRRNGNSHPN